MKILLFGATGMVGQGVLRECVRDVGVTQVVCVGRRPSGAAGDKIGDLIVADPGDLRVVEAHLLGFDACFFCLGVSSVGMSEADYRRITHDMTLGAATTLARLNPQMTFTYVTGRGTDSTEQGSSMWARVKGETENALLRLPFKAACMFRPGVIRPMHRVRSKTALYRIAYLVATPLFALMDRFAPGTLLTSEQMGRAVLAVARGAAAKPVLEVEDIIALGG